VSKRIGGAVVRNKVKRRLREAARARQALVEPGYDLVFVARKPIAEAEYQQVDQAVDELLKRSGVLRS
jgi:ribonuclease P protein component